MSAQKMNVNIPRRQLITATLGSAALLASPQIKAQAFPNKPIRIMCHLHPAARARWWHAVWPMS